MKKEILDLLTRANKLFHGELIIVPLEEYVDKIIKNALIISIYRFGELQGFIAYYDNDPNKDLAFVTMLAVNPDSRGTGYGKNLFEMLLRDAKYKGFKKARLEVLKKNPAIPMFEDLGFAIAQENETTYFMDIQLN